MRSAVFVGARQIKIEARPTPIPRADEALIQVEYVAICGSDQSRFWDSGGAQQKPVVFGHEFSGRVISAPEGISLAPGQVVTVAPLFNCGRCEFCLLGKENLCSERRRFGVAEDGALQGYVCIAADRVYSLPAHLTLEEGALVEPLAVAFHTVDQTGPPIKEGALVLGAGAIGLLIAQVWRALGYGYVTIVDIDSRRLAVAEQLGIPIWGEAPAESSFHTIFEATGSVRAFSNWLPSLAPQGKVIVVSKLEQSVAIDWVELLRKEGQILTSRYFTLADFEHSISFAEKGAVQLKPLIGRIVPFQRLSENHGVDVMSLAKEVVRLVVCVRE